MSTNKLFFISAFALLCTTGCASDWFVTHNGNMPTNERISQVNVGQSKQQVQQVLGTPSSVVSLDQNSSDETPTLGQEPGFFEKYFGGVGQYMPFGPTRHNNI